MLKDKLRKRDIQAMLLFALAWPVAQLCKKRHKNLWLISERPDEARDNGYALFRYIRTEHPQDDVRYVITSNGLDRNKVEQLGNVVDFGSFWHYVYYWMTRVHISAHVDAGTPNSRVTRFMETHGILSNKRVCLQHGVTKDCIPFCFYQSTRADLYCCQTKQETDYIAKNFGYPLGNVQHTGLARFDTLQQNAECKNQILLMPTWRAWLAPQQFSGKEQARKAFVQSSYYQNYSALLKSSALHSFLEEKNLTLVFFVHSDMQPYCNLFQCSNHHIVIASQEQFDVQTLLRESKVLITDYSSVFFDFTYLNKPACFFHFDYQEYRKRQHPEGYYNYNKGVGPVFCSVEQVVQYLQTLSQRSFRMEEQYQQFCDNFFDLRDQKNCCRIYHATQQLQQRT